MYCVFDKYVVFPICLLCFRSVYSVLDMCRVSDQFTPWLTSDIKYMFRTRDKLKTAAIKAKSKILIGAYKRRQNKANALNTKLKRQYFSTKIQSCERNLKETWATINKLINKRSKTTSITSILEDDVIITKPDGIADSINKYFCSIGEQLSNNIPKKLNMFINEILLRIRTTFSFTPLTPEQLINSVSKFKTSKGFGVDNISSFYLKKSMPFLASGLSQILNLSMSIGQFPDSWKVARVAQFIKMVQLMIDLITDLSLSCQLFPDSLKN